ncbi:hypothetical protein QUF90_00130 [Desulfococcaceae bacterium HSG9]|nr:hypothetical protein [Desulfococcaceae bacterium HSG9]
MNPIKVNLAKPKVNKRTDYAVIIVMIGILSAFAGVNGYRYINTLKEIRKYDATLARQLMNRQDAKQRSQKTHGLTLSATEIKSLKDKSEFVNRIILEDVFVWTELLDLLETTMPPTMIVSLIAVSDNLSKLTLKGRVASTHELSLFLKKINAADLFNNNILSAISVAISDQKQADNSPTQTAIGYEIVIALHTDRMLAFVDDGLKK